MKCKLEDLWEDLECEYRKPKEERDPGYILELAERMAKEPFPTTLDNAYDHQIIDEVNWRGIEDDLDISYSLSDFSDSDILEELDRRTINMPGILALYQAVQNGDSKKTLDVIREVCYYYAGRIVTVDHL